jgi:Tol biopolymer transport system component
MKAFIAFKNNVSTTTAITTIRAAKCNICFAPEVRHTSPTIASLHLNFSGINKLHPEFSPDHKKVALSATLAKGNEQRNKKKS